MKIILRKPKLSDLKWFRIIFNNKEVSSKLAGYDFPFTAKKPNLKSTWITPGRTHECLVFERYG